MKRVLAPLMLLPSLALPLSLHAADNAMKEFTKQPTSVGTLAGSIIGGALTAHPAGTMVGGVVGFFAAGRGQQEGAGAGVVTAAKQAGTTEAKVVPSRKREINPNICLSGAVEKSQLSDADEPSTSFADFGAVFASQSAPKEGKAEAPIQLALDARLQQRLCYYYMN